ncbi:universal stress protein [Pseudonocardia sp. RS010]|uniref:universal stress protein n=1 Tax=Pseudonocardia sp. RS010 TaxID=3385979 RepID=UPI0039A35F83
MSEQQAPPPIVVGVDGSVRSVAALRWAAQQARLTGAEVHAVTGWEVPVTIMMVPTYTEADYARDAHLVLDRAVAEVQAEQPDVRIATQLIQKRPALALTIAAQEAQLLVVGSHSHGGDELPGLHLGSVASYCVHHAPCPVVVIRGHEPRTSGTRS